MNIVVEKINTILLNAVENIKGAKQQIELFWMNNCKYLHLLSYVIYANALNICIIISIPLMVCENKDECFGKAVKKVPLQMYSVFLFKTQWKENNHQTEDQLIVIDV